MTGVDVTMSAGPLHSVVVPVFNEADGIAAFHERCAAALTAIGNRYEIIYVDDGSRDTSWARLLAIRDGDTNVRLMRLSRNFGHQIAVSAGIEHAGGDTVTVLDADLQDPPEVIAQMVDAWREGADIVYGVRTARRGERTRVETTVAIELAESWKPLMKSKTKATRTIRRTKTTVPFTMRAPGRDALGGAARARRDRSRPAPNENAAR